MLSRIIGVPKRSIEYWGKKLYAIGKELREEHCELHITFLASMLLSISRSMYEHWYNHNENVILLDRNLIEKWSGELKNVSISGFRTYVNSKVSSKWIDTAALAFEIEAQGRLAAPLSNHFENHSQPTKKSTLITRTRIITIYFLIIVVANILWLFPVVHSPIELMILLLTELAGSPAIAQTYDWISSSQRQ